MDEPIVLATGNAGKIEEFRALLSPRKCIPQRDLNISDAAETGSTFIENALLKAQHASRVSNKPALADDSGLVIPALDGQPGIYSSRFAGEHATDQENIELVFERLRAISKLDAHPEAFFYCVVVLIQHADDPTPAFGIGRLSGHLVSTPKGEHGFGYSPIFYVPEHQCTLAELPVAAKNKISHRAGALQDLLDSKSEGRGC